MRRKEMKKFIENSSFGKLKQKAKEMNLKGYTQMKRDELEAFLLFSTSTLEDKVMDVLDETDGYLIFFHNALEEIRYADKLKLLDVVRAGISVGLEVKLRRQIIIAKIKKDSDNGYRIDAIERDEYIIPLEE